MQRPATVAFRSRETPSGDGANSRARQTGGATALTDTDSCLTALLWLAKILAKMLLGLLGNLLLLLRRRLIGEGRINSWFRFRPRISPTLSPNTADQTF